MSKRSPEIEEGECSDDEPEIKKGKYEEFGDFVIDTTVSEEKDEKEENSDTDGKDQLKKKEAASKWSEMVTKSLLREVNPEETKDEKKRRRNCCFNCGGDHMITNCPLPKDFNRIRRAKAEHSDRNQARSSRYHVEETKDTSQKYKPGRLSGKLREALNIGPDDIPEWIYRMRRMGFYKGYPPGYLKKALKLDPTTSLLQVHSTSNEFVSSNSSVPRPAPIIDSNKIFYYMGFNHTYRSLHDLENFKVPPFELFCENLQKDVEIKHNADETRRIFQTDFERKVSEEYTENSFSNDVVIDRNGNGDFEKKESDGEPEKKEDSPEDTSLMGESISVMVGTPIMSRRAENGAWKRETLPDLEKFSVGIIPFEAKEEDTGNKGIFKKIMGKIRNFATSDSSPSSSS